ncbi:MAG: HD domain-containing phosphohydrolase [bacterium]
MVEILFVDDEPQVLSALRRVFRGIGDWEYHFANSPAEAIEILAKRNITVLVSDHKMPQMTGAEFLSRVKEKRPDTIRIMLTGQADLEAVQRAVNAGAIYRFILKPWDDENLRQVVTEAVALHETTSKDRCRNEQTSRQNDELVVVNRTLEERVALRTSQLTDALRTAQSLNATLRESLFNGAKALFSMVELSRPELGIHCRTVAEHAKQIAKSLGYNGEELPEIEIAALLHDCGKLGLPPFLLEKSVDDFSAEELNLYQMHPSVGADNLKAVSGYENVCEFILNHHEAYDGSGFPKRRRGSAVPEQAMIIGISDQYAHLINRPGYDSHFRFQYAFQRLADQSGKQYPSNVVQATLDYIETLSRDKTNEEAVRVGLSDLVPNAVLVSNIYSMSGALLLAHGATLTPQRIHRLRSIARVDPIAGEIYIQKRTSRRVATH